jgi:hypothetical protein
VLGENLVHYEGRTKTQTFENRVDQNETTWKLLHVKHLDPERRYGGNVPLGSMPCNFLFLSLVYFTVIFQ